MFDSLRVEMSIPSAVFHSHQALFYKLATFHIAFYVAILLHAVSWLLGAGLMAVTYLSGPTSWEAYVIWLALWRQSGTIFMKIMERT